MCFSRAAGHFPNHYFSVRIEGAKNAKDFFYCHFIIPVQF